MKARRWTPGLVVALAFVLPSAGMTDDRDEDKRHDHGRYDRDRSSGPLVDLVRERLARFRDWRIAVNEGYLAEQPCVSGPNEGAMGIHFVNPNFLFDDPVNGVLSPDLNVDEPEALVYEPQPDGGLRLVAAEYISGASPATLEGHLLNHVGAPNRYGLPAFSEIHVWAWRDNPNGTFADWNPRVSCEALPLPVQ